jgi:hypothetical protein
VRVVVSKRWLSIRVELISGRGGSIDSPPGRVFAVPPSTSFEDLAQAVDTAFGRWDFGHLRCFTLADGTEVSDPESNEESVSAPFGTIPKTMPLTTRLDGAVGDGGTFEYVFDFGDGWTHRCVVEDRVDPPYGANRRPVITWGWGSLPDQYGRRWADDDGSSEPPPRGDATDVPHDQHQPEPIDLRAFRIAVHAADPTQLVDTITGVELDHALQQIGTGLVRTQLRLSAESRDILEPYLLSVHGRLQDRGWPGDLELAALVLTVLQQGASPDGLRVDLEEMISFEDAEDEEPGVYVNTVTGELAPPFATDEMIVGADAVVDVDTDDWIHLEWEQADDRWQDMAEFAASRGPEVEAMLKEAIQGKGAFSRFRTVINQAELVGRWIAFSDDRRTGRARAALARHGVQAI